MDVVIFWAFALLVIGSAAMAVIARNILHAAVALAFALMGVAALYLFLHADFVAATQLIVYVGGIIVLVIFAVMFSAHIQDDTGEIGGRPLVYGGAGLVAIFVTLSLVLSARHLNPALEKTKFQPNAMTEAGLPKLRENTLVEQHPVAPTVLVGAAPKATPAAGAAVPAERKAAERKAAVATVGVDDFAPATKSIGALLLGKYLLAFEAVSILLLAVVVAAVVLVRKETARDGSR